VLWKKNKYTLNKDSTKTTVIKIVEVVAMPRQQAVKKMKNKAQILNCSGAYINVTGSLKQYDGKPG